MIDTHSSMREGKILYCSPCGYIKRAKPLAERLEKELGIKVTLVPGNFGVFKVWIGDELVFDKRTTRGWLGKIGFGHIPADDDLVSLSRLALTVGV